MNFCILLKILVKNMGEIVSKTISGKYSQKTFDHVKKSAADAPKATSKKSNLKNRRSN